MLDYFYVSMLATVWVTEIMFYLSACPPILLNMISYEQLEEICLEVPPG